MGSSNGICFAIGWRFPRMAFVTCWLHNNVMAHRSRFVLALCWNLFWPVSSLCWPRICPRVVPCWPCVGRKPFRASRERTSRANRKPFRANRKPFRASRKPFRVNRKPFRASRKPFVPPENLFVPPENPFAPAEDSFVPLQKAKHIPAQSYRARLRSQSAQNN